MITVGKKIKLKSQPPGRHVGVVVEAWGDDGNGGPTLVRTINKTGPVWAVATVEEVPDDDH